MFRKNKRNSLFTQCKTLIGNNFGRIEDRAVKFMYHNRLRPCRIEWCDGHLCPVTESDDAYQVVIKQH